MITHLWPFALALSLLFPASQALPNVIARDGLEIVSPSAMSFDERLLSQGVKAAGELDYSRSLLVLRGGKLVSESYFHGHAANTPNNLHSVSKSVISALVGIALDKGFLKSVDQPVFEFFPEFFPSGGAPLKRAITLGHLLSMSAGLDAGDDSPTNDAWARLDRAEYLFGRPMVHEPGARFSYSTQYTFAISRIITLATHMPTRDFAQKHLFDPMGVRILGWPRDALGFYWGDRIFLTSRDLAKFGQLFLNKGEYQGKRIVSRAWVELSTAPKIEGSPGNGKYGYFWWSKPDAPVPFYYAWGYGGQYVYIVPPLGVVVVMTNDFSSKRPQEKIRSVIEEYIIRAAKPMTSDSAR